MNEELRRDLERMHRDDQAIRAEAMACVQEHGLQSPAYEALRTRGREQDARHTARLLEIVDEHGWPGRSLVGDAAGRGASFVLQHADHGTQKRLLPQVRAAADAGELERSVLALLEDRVRMRDGEKQLYGTQITREPGGAPRVWPIEDEDGVDARRAALGLEPLDAYLARFGIERGDAT